MSDWISVKDRLPEHNQNILFVVYTPAWHDITDELSPENRDFPAESKTVFGIFQEYASNRYWSWDDETGYGSTIKNEYCKEYTGEVSYITHWMPLPDPPEEIGGEDETD